MNYNQLLPMFLFLSVAAVSLFSFIAVAVWSQERRREREAYYRSEMLKRIAEIPGPGSVSVFEFLREENRRAARSVLEGQKLGGMVTVALGIALMLFLGSVDRGAQLVGLIPLLIGAALLAYAYFFAPRE